MADLYLKRLESERKTLWATCRLKGLAKDTPERQRIAEIDRLIAQHKTPPPTSPLPQAGGGKGRAGSQPALEQPGAVYPLDGGGPVSLEEAEAEAEAGMAEQSLRYREGGNELYVSTEPAA